MSFLVRNIDEKGAFELINEDLKAIYKKSNHQWVAISQADYEKLCKRGFANVKLIDGVLQFRPKQPTPYHVWNGVGWELTAENEQRKLEDGKKIKLAELNSVATRYIEETTKQSETPEFERATWSIQAIEATAWHDDNNASTPNLERIASSRGVPVDILRQKAYEKTMQFEVLTSTIAGQRQKHEDEIKAAESLAELDNIVFQIGLQNE